MRAVVPRALKPAPDGRSAAAEAAARPRGSPRRGGRRTCTPGPATAPAPRYLAGRAGSRLRRPAPGGLRRLRHRPPRRPEQRRYGATGTAARSAKADLVHHTAIPGTPARARGTRCHSVARAAWSHRRRAPSEPPGQPTRREPAAGEGDTRTPHLHNASTIREVGVPDDRGTTRRPRVRSPGSPPPIREARTSASGGSVPHMRGTRLTCVTSPSSEVGASANSATASQPWPRALRPLGPGTRRPGPRSPHRGPCSGRTVGGLMDRLAKEVADALRDLPTGLDQGAGREGPDRRGLLDRRPTRGVRAPHPTTRAGSWSTSTSTRASRRARPTGRGCGPCWPGSARTSDVEAVVVHKVDRLARNMEDHIAIRALLRRRGVTFVSVTENLDETASGRLVEGIHALMAEFYSANLASEVRKGMGQKAKLGGYPHKAPSATSTSANRSAGARWPTSSPDPERAPLVKAAFELYATGEWTVERLAEEMAAPRPAQPGPQRPLRRPRRSPSRGWRGCSRIGPTSGSWNGTGSNTKAVPRAAGRSGHLRARSKNCWRPGPCAAPRERRHHHYLKGVLVCGVCGRRLSIQRSKGTYTYFYCLGQKDRRNGTGCQERYVAADSARSRGRGPLRPHRGARTTGPRVCARRSPPRWPPTTRTPPRNASCSHGATSRPTSRALQADGGLLRQRHRRRRCSGMNKSASAPSYEPSSPARRPSTRSLDDWQEVMDLALRFSTRCATAYRRGSDRTRKRFNAAVLDQVHVRDGHVVEGGLQGTLRHPLLCAEVRIRRCGGR